MKLLFTTFLLINISLFGNNCENKVQEVFNNIILSIGNNSIPEPELIFSSEERSAAYMSEESITIEYKLINLFCVEDNFEDKIAFILSHELAHYYLQHGWMLNTGLSYASTVGKSLKYKSYDLEEIKEAESQADIYAGFYGKIAGYKTLQFAEYTLNSVYESYNLPRSLKKYPSYDERVKIINDKKDQANNLATVFEIGNILIKLEKYDLAIDAFRVILASKFNSREIYNNLGLSYLMYGISISEDKLSKLIYPVYIDFQTRATVSKTRSTLNDSPEKMILKAKNYFERSINLDSDYIPAMQNLFVSKMLLEKSAKSREVLVEEIQNNSKLDSQTKVDFEVINEIFNDTKLRKVQKLAKNGSSNSRLNTDSNLLGLETNRLTNDQLLKKLNINSELSDYLFYGKPDKKITVNNNKLIYKFKMFGDIELIELDKKHSILKIPKIIYDNNFSEIEKNIFKITPYGVYVLIEK